MISKTGLSNEGYRSNRPKKCTVDEDGRVMTHHENSPRIPIAQGCAQDAQLRRDRTSQAVTESRCVCHEGFSATDRHGRSSAGPYGCFLPDLTRFEPWRRPGPSVALVFDRESIPEMHPRRKAVTKPSRIDGNEPNRSKPSPNQTISQWFATKCHSIARRSKEEHDQCSRSLFQRRFETRNGLRA